MKLPKDKQLLSRTPGFHLPYSQAVREATGMPTVAVGLIRDAEHADVIPFAAAEAAPGEGAHQRCCQGWTGSRRLQCRSDVGIEDVELGDVFVRHHHSRVDPFGPVAPPHGMRILERRQLAFALGECVGDGSNRFEHAVPARTDRASISRVTPTFRPTIGKPRSRPSASISRSTGSL